MTDFLYIPIWLVLSSIIRQIDSGIDTEPDAAKDLTLGGNDVGAPEIDPYEPIVQIIKLGIAAFSALLLGLSLSAYKRTGIKTILYAAVAFGLFAAQLLFDYLEDVVISLEQPLNDLIFYAMTLAILALFFTAIVKRK